MSGRLPEWIKPVALAAVGETLDGVMPVRDLVRFAPLLNDDSGEVQAHLEFGNDAAGRGFVSGRASVTVGVICQRCMQPMSLDLAAPVSLEIVREGQADNSLASGREPLEVGKDPVRLAEIIENELILSMPMTCLHRRCDGGEFQSQGQSALEPERKVNPFDVLKDLKQ